MKRLAMTLALVLPVIGACGGTNTEKGVITPGGPVVEYPEWVNKGSGAFGGEKKVFYGVGSAGGIRNHSLAVTQVALRGERSIRLMWPSSEGACTVASFCLLPRASRL